MISIRISQMVHQEPRIEDVNIAISINVATSTQGNSNPARIWTLVRIVGTNHDCIGIVTFNRSAVHPHDHCPLSVASHTKR